GEDRVGLLVAQVLLGGQRQRVEPGPVGRYRPPVAVERRAGRPGQGRGELLVLQPGQLPGVAPVPELRQPGSRWRRCGGRPPGCRGGRLGRWLGAVGRRGHMLSPTSRRSALSQAICRHWPAVGSTAWYLASSTAGCCGGNSRPTGRRRARSRSSAVRSTEV